MKLQLPAFYEFGHQADDGGELASANFRYFLESVPGGEQAHGFVSRRRFLYWRPRHSGAFAISSQGAEDLQAIHLSFVLAEAGDTQKFGDRCRAFAANLVERCIVHHDEGRNILLPGCDAPPLAEIVPQFGIHIRRGRLFFGLELMQAVDSDRLRVTWLLCFGCRQPLGRAAANIASGA